MRGEPVLPSKFDPLFDYPLENDSNIEQLRKISIQYDEIEHYSEKLDENFAAFNKRLTQSIADINDLLNSSYTRFSYYEENPQIETEHLSQPLASQIIQQETNNDS